MGSRLATGASRIAPGSAAPEASGWIVPSCVLCGAPDAAAVLTVAHPDAPEGRVAIVECRDCGLRRLTPRPPEDEAARHYGDGYNAFVGRRRGRLKQAIWNVARDVAAGRGGAARLPAPLRGLARWAFDVTVPLDGAAPPAVLEVGCGYGDLLRYLADRGCDVTGVDVDPRAVARGAADGLAVLQGPLRALDLPAGRFDVAVLCHSLEHVADPAAEVREIARLLRPGGTLHVAVPNGRAAGLVADGAEWEHVSAPHHLWFFDRDTLARLLRAAGFEPLRPPVVTSSYRPVARWLREAARFGPVCATRNLGRWCRARARGAGGGDVVRVIARRR